MRSLKDYAGLAPGTREHFHCEIEYLLTKVPTEIWQNKSICGAMYDFLPWQKFSSIAIQTRNDDRSDPTSWTYYNCASSDSSIISDEVRLYGQTHDRLVLHWLLIRAAEAFLEIDFSPYGKPITIEDGFIYSPFQLQVVLKV